jgi:hypothetical protein
MGRERIGGTRHNLHERTCDSSSEKRDLPRRTCDSTSGKRDLHARTLASPLGTLDFHERTCASAAGKRDSRAEHRASAPGNLDHYARTRASPPGTRASPPGTLDSQLGTHASSRRTRTSAAGTLDSPTVARASAARPPVSPPMHLDRSAVHPSLPRVSSAPLDDPSRPLGVLLLGRRVDHRLEGEASIRVDLPSVSPGSVQGPPRVSFVEPLAGGTCHRVVKQSVAVEEGFVAHAEEVIETGSRSFVVSGKGCGQGRHSPVGCSMDLAG